jgi:hypothetical protein
VQGAWDDTVDWFTGLERCEPGILLGFAGASGLDGCRSRHLVPG